MTHYFGNLQMLRMLLVYAAFLALTGCASVQDTFCNMIEPDSYVLVSVADCQTMRTSFHYDRDTDFSLLKSYAWMPDEHADDAAGSLLNHQVINAHALAKKPAC